MPGKNNGEEEEDSEGEEEDVIFNTDYQILRTGNRKSRT